MKELLTTAKVKIMVVLLCLCTLAMPFASANADVIINEIMYHPTLGYRHRRFPRDYTTPALLR